MTSATTPFRDRLREHSRGSTGADSFVALDGNDNILLAQSNDIVDLGDGQDTVTSTKPLMVHLFLVAAATF